MKSASAGTYFEALFSPRRVAVVGASDQPGKVGSIVMSNLASFEGEVIPISNSVATVAGRKAYQHLADVPGAVDLVVVAVPAAGVVGVIREAASKAIPVAVVLSGGFAESGPDGIELQVELAEVAKAGGVRVVGPNCFGVQNTAVSFNASISAGVEGGLDEAEGGVISLLTQSGAYGMAIHAMGREELMRFGKVYASGNKVEIDDHEVIDFLSSDSQTDVICLFAESVGDGRELAKSIRAASPHKPVIVAKTGRSTAGGRAARSHTGSLATSDFVFRGALRQAGAVVVRSGLEMLDVARLLSTQPLPGGRRAAIITNSGGTGVELVDLLSDAGIEVPELSENLRAMIADRLPLLASPRNPVDMTPIWSRYAELYPWLIDLLARSGEVDMVIPILLHRAAMDIDTVKSVAKAVDQLRADGVAVPVCVCWIAPAEVRSHAAVLQAAGVPCLEWPDRTAVALGHMVAYSLEGRLRPPPASPLPSAAPLPGGPLPTIAAQGLLEDAGIRCVSTIECADESEVVHSAEVLGYPVVMKAADPTIAHRHDIGGIRLDLRSEADVIDAYRSLGEHGQSVLIQPQITGVELFVGGLTDPAFGPTVMVGSGGTLVEASGDVAVALAPITESEAMTLIAGLKAHQLLTGFRGSPRADIAALAKVTQRLGDLLASHPEITEIDLNPVMVDTAGAVAVDWKVTVS